MKKASGSRLYKWLCSCLLGAAAVAAMPGLADAQAWVDSKGSLSGAAHYIGAFSDDLIDPRGNAYKGEDLSITNHTLTLGLEYVPLAKLGVSFEVPLLAVQFSGDQDGSFPAHGEYDDGNYHFTPTDARLGVRYQVLDGFRALSPHLAVSAPMTDYPITGFAGGGRGIFKGHLGLSGGIVFDPWVPNLFFHATAEYTIGTKPTVDDPMFEPDALDEYSQSYIGFNASLGYFIGKSFIASLVVNAHFQQDGVTFDDVPFGNNADQMLLFKYHDVVLDEDYILPGLDLSYAISDALSLTGHFRMLAVGSNTRNIIGGGLGLSYSMRPSPPVVYADDDESFSLEEWNDEEPGVDVEGGVEAEVDVDAEGAVDMSDEAGADEEAADEEAPSDDSDL